jgi:hypothetical protein|tara:strand:- start:29778 stop:30317 length:540 start_codon:yes stop_codon:yes gene_type:complete
MNNPVPVNRAARSKDLDDGQKNSILQLLAKGKTIKACSEHVGVTTYSIRKARQEDDQFALMFADAYETGTEGLEEVAWERATVGVPTEHFDKNGTLRNTTHQTSDRLMEVLLKGRNPLKYRDSHHTVKHEGGFTDTVELKFNSVEAKGVMDNVRKALGLGTEIDGTASPVVEVHSTSPD